MLTVEIVTPYGEFFKGETSRVIARAQEGDLAVLPGMAAITTPLQIGTVRIQLENKEELVTVSGGYLSNDNNRLVIVTEAAEWSSDIDIERAKKALARAEERMRAPGENTDVQRAELALKRALNRINHAE